MAGELQPGLVNGYLAISASTNLSTTTSSAPLVLSRNNNLKVVIQNTLAATTDLYIAANDVQPGQVLQIANATTSNIICLSALYTGTDLFPTATYATILPGVLFDGLYYTSASTGRLTVIGNR